MEVENLIIEVQDVVQDEKYDSSWVIGIFNDALNSIATSCRIPGLQSSADVVATATENHSDMPVAYLHDLYAATSITYPRGLIIAPNLKELIVNELSDQTGVVQLVTVDGSVLNFRPIPEVTETLTLYFYTKPALLQQGDSFPDYIPEIMQKDLFVNYALNAAYLQIEDGIDGRIPNTQKYAGLYTAAVASLNKFFPNVPKGRVVITRAGSFF